LWAIATQRRDWPGWQPDAIVTEPLPEPVFDARPAVEPAIS
jgi:hypothetical protein